ncbi:replication initiator protein A [Cetobacterium sp. SF1]|uniref:replication initiator protein A n=1 Tax=Cetobacterium sp. SF1 TaxID=3417654 RepID=UPI003CEBA80D
MNFIKKENLNNFKHLQIPKLIWTLFIEKKIDQSTFKIYVELFQRLKISASNNWIDEKGNIYIKYSYEELKNLLSLKSDGTIASSLKQLKELNLLIQVKGFNTSSIFYLRNILEKDNKNHSSSKNCSTTKNSSTVLQKNEDQSSKKLETNYNNYNNNNFNKIMNQETYDIFKNLFKELGIELTNKNQKSILQLLKTQSLEEIKNYLRETFYNIKNNPQVKNPFGVFTKKIEKGERQESFNLKSKSMISSNGFIHKNTEKYIKNQKEIKDILTKENEEKKVLDLYFNSLSKHLQNTIMTQALELARKEMINTPSKVIEITSKITYKYSILRSLYTERCTNIGF